MVKLAMACAAMCVALLPAAVAAHPLHTSFVELSHAPRTGEVEISLRAFADDFTAAAEAWRARRGGKQGLNEALVAYATASVDLADIAGKTIPMAFCGMRRSGDMIWICLRGREAARGRGIRILNRALFERFSDQINVVRANYGGRVKNLLFTAGDGAEILRRS